ncbi:hypothetical protein PENFLA_c069G02111 [Penicillium flavigenum]|uniref:Protein NO VEIN C-terminal domain-containing protein n=1 Tax=Penicillium flavigenum TaxID=254877 RepID=A0A1V6SE91_9EURO|nr:hypothetical protein PENFLA_c069G02111 [Penicillium flavigenum]
MTSRHAAKNAVMGIAKEYGFIQPSSLDEIERFNPKLRREIEESMLAKDKKIGHSIETLAKNIYSSNARFVFELLQNADDNRFTRATARNDLPFISFKVYPDRIVLECNEDGFTKENLSAICSVGESTKAASHGYIGAKGIGFKSVFIAAWKVDIQSGNYSFYFKHEKGDPGLGMVLPVWQDSDEVLPDPLTRITLHLHQNGETEDIEHLHRTIFKQLDDLEQTCLLFLRNLKEIQVSFYDGDDNLQSSKKFYLENNFQSDVFLKTESIDEDGNREIVLSREKAIMSLVTWQLAFLKATIPLLEQQSVFAFLPVRETNLKFLIQSDFDTTASRQDISSSSRRNIELKKHTALAFVQAITGLLHDPDLGYTWPMYLPSADDASGTFWADLHSKIASNLGEQSVVKTRHGYLRKIKDVCILAVEFMDGDGNPLLDDSDIDPFLSSHYTYASRNTLRPYGLQAMHYNLVRLMLNKDLESSASRIQSMFTSEDDHSRIAKLLSKVAKINKSWLEPLPLLPLRNGPWVPANSGSVFFPTVNGISVPPGLDLRVLDATAAANECRRSLFVQLGVTDPSVPQVRDSVLSCSATLYPSIYESRAHLRFLYLTHQFSQKKDELRHIFIYSHSDIPLRPYHADCYFPSDHPYGPEALLRATDDLPGFRVCFIHPTYLEEAPAAPHADHPSWNRWLHDNLGLRDKLRLVARDGRRLSLAWDYVASFQPEKLLGLLQHLWSSEGETISKNDALKQLVRETDAKRLCVTELPEQCQLDQTYLPLPNLLEQSSRFLNPNESLPFLDLGGPLSVEQLGSKWIFLHTALGVKKDEDVDFLLDILRWLKRGNPLASSVEDYERIFRLYGAINAKYLGAESQLVMGNCVKNFFENEYIYIPKLDEDDDDDDDDVAFWCSPEDCLWEAPLNMITKFPLQRLYEQCIPRDQLFQLSTFFKQTLGITAAFWSDVTAELAARRDDGWQEFTPIFDLYMYLDDTTDLKYVDDIRHAFDIEPLIFVTRDGQSGWYRATDCLWSSTTEIRGMVTLNDHYEDLKDFFIDTLGVKTLTLQMVYDDLLETSANATINDTKSKIWSLNALLEAEDYVNLDPKPLLRRPIFPVVYPDGTKALRSGDIQFAITDREHLASRFRGKIKILDFTQEEVRQLKTFFEWTGLSYRYFSVAVKELTSLSGETTRLHPLPNRDLKRKAHSILRIAGTFNSPRYQADPLALYELLQAASIETTDGIVSILRISQDGKVADVEELVGKLHISEEASRLSIYVPRDRKAQELCFCDLLPKQLVDWLMRDPTTQILDKVENDAINVMSMILNIHPSATDLVLERQGIVEVDIPNEDPDIDPEIPLDSPQSPGTTTTEDVPYSGDVVTPFSSRHSLSQRNTPEQVTTHSHNLSHSRPTPMYSPNIDSSEDSMPYRRLLDHVLVAARRAMFPSRGAFNMSQLNEALPAEEGRRQFDGFDGIGVTDAFRSHSQIERDRKIGAAGELYVFELLARLNPALTDWSERNWQSTIRRYVTVHPDYADMEPWYGRETADLTYDDRAGEFTALLIDRGYLDAEEWADKRPKYFIEVKATTGPLSHPFFMSKYQYKRMRVIHNRNDYSEVYLIFRVFDIRGDNLGMSVYFDPEQLRLDGGLLFTGETWAVVPRGTDVNVASAEE